MSDIAIVKFQLSSDRVKRTLVNRRVTPNIIVGNIGIFKYAINKYWSKGLFDVQIDDLLNGWLWLAAMA